MSTPAVGPITFWRELIIRAYGVVHILPAVVLWLTPLGAKFLPRSVCFNLLLQVVVNGVAPKRVPPLFLLKSWGEIQPLGLG